MGGDLVDQRDPDALELDRPRHLPALLALAADPTAIGQHQGSRKDGDHAEPGEQDRGARDEAELLEAAEVGGHQDVERAGRGHRAQQDPGSAPPRRHLQRLAQAAAEEELLLVPEEEVDAVVDPDPDDDRDEHHREERQVTDEQRRGADGPAEAEREHDEHDDRLARPCEGDDQEAEGEREGQERGLLAVLEGRRHLVGGERGFSGDPHADARELLVERGDDVTDGLDRAAVAGEAATLRLRLGQDEEQPLVVGQEVAGARLVALHREQRAPGRAVGQRMLEPSRNLGDQVLDEPEVAGRLRLVLDAEVEEPGGERVGDLGGEPLHELLERGPGREGFHELLIVEDLVADGGQLLAGEVEERAALELLGVDPVGQALERGVPPLELAHEPGGVDLGLGERARLDHDDDVVELAELLVELTVALDVGLALREEGAGRRREGEGGERVPHGQRSDHDRDPEREQRDGARAPHEQAERAADLCGDRQLLFAADEPFESLARLVIRPLLGRGLHQVGRGRHQRALDAAIERDTAGADGVDHHAG